LPQIKPKFSGYVEKIYGPPGCGKTSTLIKHLKAEIKSGTPPSRIGYVSFTTAAANEVKQRIGSSPEWFRTIHSACCRLIGIGPNDILGRAEISRLEAEGFSVRRQFSVEDVEDLPEDGRLQADTFLFAMSLASHRMVPLIDVVEEMVGFYPNFDVSTMEDFLGVYRQIKAETGRLDYEDMIEMYVKADNWQPAPIDVLFIDEAQDLSALQWEAVHRIGAAAKRVYIAGDDDQSIYGFIGAEEYGFLDHDCSHETVLDHSYRCPRAVGERATDIIRQVPRRKHKHVTWRDAPGDVRDIGFHPSGGQLVDMSSSGSVMYLTRHRYQLRAVHSELNRNRVPHSVKGFSLTTSPMARAVRAFLALRAGRDVEKAEAKAMLTEFGFKDEAKALLKGGQKTVSPDDVSGTVDLKGRWPDYFDTEVGMRSAAILDDMIDLHGPEVLGAEPRIALSTMHGAKGREADYVVIETDCTETALRSHHGGSFSEIRLAYVALTRARRRAIVVANQTMTYMAPFYEAGG